MKPSRKIAGCVLLVLGVLIALMVSLAYITPRVINREAIKTAIETTISKELGGTLTYDRIDLAILPRPGIVIRNPAIKVPQILSGRMNSLEISPSLLPLFAWRFEIARVVLDSPDFTFELEKGAEEQQGQEPAGKQDISRTIEMVLAVTAARMPHISIMLRHGIFLTLKDGKQQHSFRDVSGSVAFQAGTAEAKEQHPAGPEQRKFRMVGKLSCIADGIGQLPGPVRLSIGRFEALPKSLSILQARASLSDLTLVLSGRIDGYLTTVRKADLTFDGSLGEESVRWIRDTLLLPPELTIHAPIDITRTRMKWRDNGSTHLVGNGTVGRGGPALSFDLSWRGGAFEVKELRVKDAESEALLTLFSNQQFLDVSFQGSLAHATLNRLFEHKDLRFGWVRGNLRVRLEFDQPARSTAEGTLAGEGLVIPYILRVPFTVETLNLRADGQRITIDPVVLSLAQSRVAAQGNVDMKDNGMLLDLDLLTDGIGWNALRELLVSYPGESGKRAPLDVLGGIKLRAGFLATDTYTFRNVDAAVQLEAGRTRLTLNTASVCGISVPGTVTITPEETMIDLHLSAQGLDLASDLACITRNTVRASGSYLLSGSISAHGLRDRLQDKMNGAIILAAEKGRVYHDLVVIRTMAYLNVTDLLRGRYENIERDGVPYDSFTARATIANGVITFNEAVLKSPVVNIVGRGNVNLPDKTMDLTLLAAPFTNVDAVVRWIPLVGKILGGSLVSIPVRIKGPYSAPKVTTLPASSIGEGLFGMMKRTLTLPFTIIEPIIPKGKKQTENEQAN